MMTKLDHEPVHVCERRGGQFPTVKKTAQQRSRKMPLIRHFENPKVSAPALQ